MAISDIKKEQIAEVIIKILYSRFESFPQDASGNRNAPFHEAFLKAFSNQLNGRVSDTAFFLSMSSWLHGLNTTMGQTFFEAVAHVLSDGFKKEFTSGKGRAGTLQITQKQKNLISEIITELSNNERVPNLLNSNSLLFIPDTEPLTNAIDFSADVFIETNDEIIAIELKSVKPNSGEMRGEKQKILEGKAALYRKYPGRDIKFYIGFPFDPTNSPSEPTRYNKARFTASIINMDKYFDHDEVLLSSELWDFLSGSNSTMDELLSIINDIATPSFMDDFVFLSDNSNRNIDRVKYLRLLRSWHLKSEIEILNSQDALLMKIATNKRLQKVYNKSIFDSKKGYNRDRYSTLMKLL